MPSKSTDTLAPTFTVKGLAFEIVNLANQQAVCVGFDSLVVGCLRFDDLNELNEVLGLRPWFADLSAKLDLMAQRSADKWYKEELPSLREYLARR